MQNVCICFLVLEYSGKGNMGSMMIAALAGAGFLLFNSDIVDMELLQYLQMGAGIVGTASKLPQILGNWREGGTGQLSAFTVSLKRITARSWCRNGSDEFLDRTQKKKKKKKRTS